MKRSDLGMPVPTQAFGSSPAKRAKKESLLKGVIFLLSRDGRMRSLCPEGVNPTAGAPKSEAY